MSIMSVMLSNHLILCYPLLLLLQSSPVSWLFSSGGQSIGTSASASVLLMNIQGWFPIGLTGLISLWSRGLSRVFSSTTVWKHQFGIQPSLWSNSYIRMTTWKTIALTIPNFVSIVMSLLFNTLSTFVIALLPRSKCLLISWLKSPSAMTLETKKIKSVTASTFPHSVCYEVMGPDIMILVFFFLMLSSKLTFSLSSFTLIKRLFSSFLLSAIRVV